MGQLISSSQVFATPGMSPSRKRSGPAGTELTRRTAASKHPATKHRYVESQLPEGGRFCDDHNSLHQFRLLGGSLMKRYFLALLLCLVPMFPSTGTFGQQTSFKALAFYSAKVEPDHVLFAEGALKFFSDLSAKNNFTFDSTSNWDGMNDFNLGKYQVVVWLNDQPSKAEQRLAFKNTLKK